MSHYPRSVVQAALDVVKPLLADHCEILTPAGSYRRGLAQCRDLDLVAVPSEIHQQRNMFGGSEWATRSTLTDRLAELREAGMLDFMGWGYPGIAGGKLGDRMARFWLTQGACVDARPDKAALVDLEITTAAWVPIDLYIVLPPATYAVILAIRTGSADWNRAMMAWLKSTSNPAWSIRDGALWRDGLCFHDGQQDFTEQALYGMVGLPYVEPEHRGTMRDFQGICR